ncbi:Hypothetical predicted protein [Mytilus galloprovincialis]|uniref:Uncharacterized protein n=1 Tax=Mytilus galloprovincialis TaxID=29158 RepID=A0A8B6F6B2_MYTGA|nr:Hypothetical predicted protein [Mytilus galloprovincialis]
MNSVNEAENAIQKGDAKEVKNWLDRGAAINAILNDNGNTALHLASCGSLPVTVILVEHGSRVDAKNIKGNTAIAEAEAESIKRQKKNTRGGSFFNNVTDNPQNRYKVLTQKEDNLQATKNPPKIEKDIQLPWLVDAIEFQRMLSHGEFLSYENRLSLGGPCRAGKSTLASVLIGEKIPQKWNSTDGLVIFFGRNGIDIERNKMVPLKEGM